VLHKDLCFELPSEIDFKNSEVAKTGISYLAMLHRLGMMIDGVEPASVASPKSCVDIIDWHPMAGKVLAACQNLAKGLEVDFQDGCIDVGTRDNGDMENDRPGAEDIKNVNEFVARIKQQFPNIVVENSSCDEWVCVSFSYGDMNEHTLSTTAEPELNKK
jgi:hypothetical protein